MATPTGGSGTTALELTIYDDGRVKVGRKHAEVDVIDVMNRQRGGSNWGSAHVTARFRRADL